jgi:hypothetical protein
MGTGPCTGFHGSKKLNARTCSGSVNPEQVQSFLLATVMICLKPAWKAVPSWLRAFTPFPTTCYPE